MKRNVIETVMGAVVLVVAAGFLSFAYNAGNVAPVNGYLVKASFGSASGIALGSDVRIGGIKVGVVSKMELDSRTYQAVLSLELKKNVEIPSDSSAMIATDGLLGNAYISIVPGSEEEMLKAGESIAFTQSSVNLVELIGKMVFSGGGVDGGKPGAAASASGNP